MPDWRAELRRRLTALRLSPEREAEIADEVAQHLEDFQARAVAAGASAADAERAALAELDARDLAAELRFGERRMPLHVTVLGAAHPSRGGLLRGLWYDLRIAARGLVRAPALLVAVTLTLALGIGSTTTVFSVVHAVLLNDLPYPAVHELVVPHGVRRSEPSDLWSVTALDYQRWRGAGVFQQVALYGTTGLDLVVGDDPVRIQLAVVTDEFFPALGITPVRGRLPSLEEYKAGTGRPIVFSYGLAQRFGGADSLVGKTIRMTGVPVDIVGVLKKGEGWPRDADAWYPQRNAQVANDPTPDNYANDAIARLRPGQSIDDARRRLDALAVQVEQEFPQKRRGMTVTAIPITEELVDTNLSRALWILFGGVACVLLIACANVANLLLARAGARRSELAVRVALGASRRRVIRQLLLESVVLAIPGGVLGVALAAGLVRLMLVVAPADVIPRLSETGLHWPVLILAIAVTFISAIGVGAASALHGANTPPVGALTGARTTSGARTRRVASALVVAEVALSITLLTGAGLLLHSFARLAGVDSGFDVARTFSFQVALPQTMADSTVRTAFWADLRRELTSRPGIEDMSYATSIPLNGGGFYLGRTMVRDAETRAPESAETPVMWSWVAPRYFRTLGQRILAGREFTDDDARNNAPVMVVTRAFARAMFGDRNAIGERVRSWRDENITREIVGVVADSRFTSAGDSLARPAVYVPTSGARYTAVVVVRTRSDPRPMIAEARNVLKALNPSVAMASPQTMPQIFAASTARSRVNAMMMALFAGSALALAAVGLYGLLAYQVSQRHREIGVRMALGATQASVAGLVVRRAAVLVTAGIVVGSAGAFAATRLMRSLLFEIGPADPLSLIAAPLVLAAVALAAAWIPARNAAAIDPATTLRE